METYRNDFGITSLSLQVGENDTERRLVWFQVNTRKGPRVRYAKASDYDRDGGFTEENSTVIEAKTEIPCVNGDKYLSCKVRLKNLELGEEYIYNVGDENEYDLDVYRFTMTKDPKKKCRFGIISDVHFNVYQRKENDVYYHLKFVNFSECLRHIREYGEELPAFVMSIGDNASVYHMGVERFAHPENKTLEGVATYSEKEHEEFFSIPFMKMTPLASVLGNHDALCHSEATPYAGVTRFHYDMPNDDGKTGHFADNSHGDFYFTCGHALIIGLNSIVHTPANYCGSAEDHRAFILKAIDAHPEAKWRIIFNHVPAYSYVGGADYNASGNETETYKMRKIFAEMLKDIHIDVIFTGHVHAFSRSYNILDGEVVDADKIVSTRDENGNLVAYAKDTRGTLHYNAPAPANYSSFHSIAFIAKNCNDFYANYGIAQCTYKKCQNDGIEAVNYYKGFIYTQPMFTHVDMEETDTTYKMTIKCVGANDDVAHDTYTVEKSK